MSRCADCRRSSPVDSVTIRELLGQLQIALLVFLADCILFRLLETLKQFRLIFLLKDLVGHGKQAVIFLLDMLTKQIHVVPSVIHKLFRGVLLSAILVFNGLLHAADGIATYRAQHLRRDSGRDAASWIVVAVIIFLDSVWKCVDEQNAAQATTWPSGVYGE